MPTKVNVFKTSTKHKNRGLSAITSVTYWQWNNQKLFVKIVPKNSSAFSPSAMGILLKVRKKELGADIEKCK